MHLCLVLIEGLAEFIPVSAMARMLVAQKLFGIPSGDAVFAFPVLVQHGDYCCGIAWGPPRLPDSSWQNVKSFEGGSRITYFGQGESGETCLLDIRGAIYRP